jgi:hypothetical protein
VPASAVLVESGARRGHVWVLQGGQLLRREVQLGVQGARATEIRAGLDAGETVVTDPRPALREGQAARARS